MSSPQQRYVSDELTHFVGRGEPEEEQYRLLVEILRTGWLSHPPHDPDVFGHISIDRDARLSENEMYAPQAVCFGDIPVGDLDVHVRKYSRFGLGFLKEFLVTKGVNPVFYIARDSLVPVPLDGERDEHGAPRIARIPRGEYFDRMVQEYHALRDLAPRLRAEQEAPSAAGAASALALDCVTALEARLERLEAFLDYGFFSYLKFFDARVPDHHPENYYLEREWRVVGNVDFQLSDVRRVILPEAYAVRFRRDVPEYCGQITFLR